MSALLLPSETLTLGTNLIVRPGDPIIDWQDMGCEKFVAPQDWVALTEPCPHPRTYMTMFCPDCRDGRRLTDFGGVKAIVVAVEPEPDGRNWRITLEVAP